MAWCRYPKPARDWKVAVTVAGSRTVALADPVAAVGFVGVVPGWGVLAVVAAPNLPAEVGLVVAREHHLGAEGRDQLAAAAAAEAVRVKTKDSPALVQVDSPAAGNGPVLPARVAAADSFAVVAGLAQRDTASPERQCKHSH